ncbi:transcriptional regulator, LysR family [Aliiroseovarius halocynthiae]|uniref:LysR family transcriptional regulator n=1 Tax=Aliiroseovarius halocynthiae TaxID=985055 RepID=A0A545SQC9_9RHOB|nr:LysR family transcriptional regulator [Aliiroseovarius halocynthiae]TQV67086.1 LysR family transcriptional regulator [Aliiroseovarius halocynthiae]SMR82190.1 transcriptional regulator, LysR family [Aliiroseovarius halocynthiae]
MDNPLSNLPLDWVHAFEVAGRLGSFTAAATETGLTQAAISQRIGHLETRLGVALFIRKPRGVVLSVEGEAWLPYVTHALGTLRHSSEELFGIQRTRLTVWSSTSVLEHWIAPRLAGLSLGADVQLSFKTLMLASEDTPQSRGVRLRYGSGDWNIAHRARLYDEELAPVVAPALMQGRDPAHWQDLPRIGLSGPRMGWHEWASQTGDAPTPIPHLRFDTFTAALSAACAGAGVLLASLPLITSALKRGELIRLSPQSLRSESSYWMVAEQGELTKRQWVALTTAFCA